MIYYIDTNYFLRFFLDDNQKKTKKVRELFLKASIGEGEIKLVSSVVVLLEVYWVLKSFYGFAKNQIFESLEAILKMDFIKFDQEKIISLAIEIFKNNNLDLEDCFHLAYSSKNYGRRCELATFDKKLATAYKQRSD